MVANTENGLLTTTYFDLTATVLHVCIPKQSYKHYIILMRSFRTVITSTNKLRLFEVNRVLLRWRTIKRFTD